jgi:hypothetical protein
MVLWCSIDNYELKIFDTINKGCLKILLNIHMHLKATKLKKPVYSKMSIKIIHVIIKNHNFIAEVQYEFEYWTSPVFKWSFSAGT